MQNRPLIEVSNLRIAFQGRHAEVAVVRDVSFSIDPGRTLALVGESGSGKSMTGLALMRLLPKTAMLSGSIAFHGVSGPSFDIVQCDERQMRAVRTRRIGIIFQEPMTSLSPVHCVGDQLAEAVTLHLGKRRSEAMERAEALLTQVGIPDPAARLRAYPHQLSGGMRQRVMIAMALSCDPELLIADEPTTALDVTVQAQIVDLLVDLQRQRNMAMLFITHNLALVSQMADHVAVMYAGKVVESAPASDIFANPLMPYTRALLGSMPVLNGTSFGKRLRPVPGTPPRSDEIGAGCSFKPRCDHAFDLCAKIDPPAVAATPRHGVRCLRWQEFGEKTP